jgi:pilus assembly protein Flp/PilA
MKEKRVLRTLKRLWKEETGQGLSEYTLILTIVAIAVIAVAVLFRDRIASMFRTASSSMEEQETTPLEE